MAAVVKYPTFNYVYNILDRNSAKITLLTAVNEQFGSHKGKLTRTQMDIIWNLICTYSSSHNQDRFLYRIFPDCTQRIKIMQAQLHSTPHSSPPSLSSFEIYFVEYNRLRGLHPLTTCQHVHDAAMTVISAPTHTPAIDLPALKPRLKKYWSFYSALQQKHPAANEKQLHMSSMRYYKAQTVTRRSNTAFSAAENAFAKAVLPQLKVDFPSDSEAELYSLIAKEIVSQRTSARTSARLQPQIPQEELLLLSTYWQYYFALSKTNPTVSHDIRITQIKRLLVQKFPSHSASGAPNPILQKLPALLQLYGTELRSHRIKSLLRAAKNKSTPSSIDQMHSRIIFSLVNRHIEMVVINEGGFLIKKSTRDQLFKDHYQEILASIQGNNLPLLKSQVHNLIAIYSQYPTAMNNQLDNLELLGVLSPYIREHVEHIIKTSTIELSHSAKLIDDKIGELAKDHFTCLAIETALSL